MNILSFYVYNICNIMLKARLTTDNQWIIVESDNAVEMKQLRLSYTKKIPNWYIIKKKASYANVDETFMNSYGMIPKGLWLELVKICKKYNYSLQFTDDFNCRIKNCNITREDFDAFIDNLFSNSSLIKKDYQIDGVFNILQYQNCCAEVSTSGGKTLMTYLLFKYMIDKLGFKHILYVTPKTDLTTQSSDKFADYDKACNIQSNWTYNEIHGAAKKKEEYNETIVFGNYQSLCKKKKSFFDKYDVVIIDECHHTVAKSIRSILNKCDNAKYKIGLTGTFPKEDTYENFILQSYIGPVVYRLSSYDLINKENFATPVIVSVFELKYLEQEKMEAMYNLRMTKDKDDPTAGGKLLTMEKMLARESKLRFKYITEMILKTTKNSLVIFSDIQNDYGVKVYNYLKENSDKSVYYIDGSVAPKNREAIKQEMENDDTGNTIIVASVGCFTEGIDIANMWNIFLIESTKSDTTLAQLLGRGMRRHPKKDKTMMIDFVDDFRYGQGYQADNYLYRHGKERQSIYRKRGFPCKVFSISIKPTSIALV